MWGRGVIAGAKNDGFVGRTLASILVGWIPAIVAVTLLVRTQPVTSMPRLILAVAAPYVALAGVCGAALALLRRRTALRLFALALVTVALLIQVSWYYLARPVDVGEHKEIRVLASNIRRGQADAPQFVGLARRNADVLTVAELTADAIDRLGGAGIDGVFPHSFLIPAPGAAGIGIWSRYPLILRLPPRHGRFLMPAARLRIPGVRVDPVLASVHVMSPVAGSQNTVDGWRDGMASLERRLTDLAAVAGPGAVIVGGDFNSTSDMRQFRDLLTGGYRDAVEATGSGFAPTYPSDSWFPPLIAVDHVLTRNAAASSVRAVEVTGSDHRSLLVTVRVPLDPDGG